MNIGYACLTIGVPYTNYKSCMLKNANEENLLQLISYNLNSLENVIDYNIKNNIKLFRISSDIIPFGSNPINNIKWWQVFSYKLSNIGEKIKNSGMRVSMHPGQYTVLNSPKEEVVKKAIEDLNYHAKFLKSLNIGIDGKIVLHIGGVYNDKSEATKRFIKNYNSLDDLVKQRLVIENDDKSSNIKDVLEIAKIINIPVVFDNLHNQVNPYNKNESDYCWINKCKKTWEKQDGYQKIHYSQQDPFKKPGSHSQTIYINEFVDFFKNLQRNDIDIMLEVKDKNLSAIKCINCTSDSKSIKDLEIEWDRYKYKILENSPLNYIEIRKLLKNKNFYPAMEFYNLIEKGLNNRGLLTYI